MSKLCHAKPITGLRMVFFQWIFCLINKLDYIVARCLERVFSFCVQFHFNSGMWQLLTSCAVSWLIKLNWLDETLTLTANGRFKTSAYVFLSGVFKNISYGVPIKEFLMHFKNRLSGARVIKTRKTFVSNIYGINKVIWFSTCIVSLKYWYISTLFPVKLVQTRV